jgi:hypothetical protein
VTIYLYGLILGRSAHLVPAHITGVAASALRVVGCDDGELGALVSTLERAPQRASLDDIRAHDHALQSVVHHGSTAAAVRFGQTFPSDGDIRKHVAESGARVARLLDTYDGCVEMRLLLSRVPDGDAPPAESSGAPSGPGRAYLEHLRESGQRLKGLALAAAIGPIVMAEKVEEIPGGRGVVFSHLIRREDENAYREAVAAIPSLSEGRVVGPLALYSFAEAE